MSARILSGEPVVEVWTRRVEVSVAKLAKEDIRPALVIIDVSGDPGVKRFVAIKEAACARLGINVKCFFIDPALEVDEMIRVIHNLAADPRYDGVLLEEPLPEGYCAVKIWDAVPVEKDMTGIHPYNLGCLMTGVGRMGPVVSQACLTLLDYYEVSLAGRRVVIIGRDSPVLQSLVVMLSRRKAVVTLCPPEHIERGYTRQADLVLCAANIPGCIGASIIRPGATVIDLGATLMDNGELVGDIDFDAVSMVASAIVPGQGGIGPVSTVLLFERVVEACARRSKELQDTAKGGRRKVR